MIVVCGATGRVGGAVVRALGARGVRPRCVVRVPDAAGALLGPLAEFVAGDFDDPAGLGRALAGAQAVFLATPVHERLPAQQRAVVAAALAAGVPRIVKLSGSSWTMGPGAPSVTGAAHAEVEAALRATRIETVALRPNAFMQGTLGRVPAQARAGEAIALPLGAARVSFIDVRDIAAVAVQALLAPRVPDGPLVLTGPEALSGADVARIASAACGRALEYRPVSVDAALAAARDRGESAHGLRHLEEVLTRIGRGEAAAVSDTVARVCGRPARALEAWLRDEASARA